MDNVYHNTGDVYENVEGQPTQTTQPSPQPEEPIMMTGCKRALLVGVDKYTVPGADLNGCVNDSMDMYDLLTKNCGFELDNVRLLANERATQQNILERLQWLVDASRSGDLAIFHFSGHGSQVRDRDNDELDDGMDEIFCPHDLDWDNPLTDDKIAQILINIKDGVELVVIADCCHSGTITRSLPRAMTSVGDEFKVRFLNPPIDILMRSEGRELVKNTLETRLQQCGSDLNHVLISGCQPYQTSAEAIINGKSRGALTFHFTKVVRENGALSWRDTHAKTVQLIKTARFEQDPGLYGPDSLLEKKAFGK